MLGRLSRALTAVTATLDLRETICFAVVGGAATAIYLVVALAGTALGFPAFLSSLAAYGIATLVSYGGHRMLTFRSAAPIAETAPRFAMLSAAQFGIALAIPAVLSDWAGISPGITYGTVCVLIPVMSFFLMARCVFRSVRAAPSTTTDEAARG